MATSTSSIFAEVRYYRKLSQHFQSHLAKEPEDWIKFQEVFNLTVDKIYKDIQAFEKENIAKMESRVYKLKKIFERRYRRYFLFGEFIKWSYDKPFGYSGDFKIIDDIYRNCPRTNGFDRLWDNYFQSLAICKAVRERKDDFKKIILDVVRERIGHDIRIMNLACGPARELKELIESDKNRELSKVFFDCYDLDLEALDYAKSLINGGGNVKFSQKNAIRIALKKEVKDEIMDEYDLIYSSGLFDYLDERIAIRLVSNLKKLLKKNGILAVANVGDKYCNSSAGWMEWVAEWNLIYRSEAQFRKIFLNAGFPQQSLRIISQSSKIVQYCLAKNGC